MTVYDIVTNKQYTIKLNTVFNIEEVLCKGDECIVNNEFIGDVKIVDGNFVLVGNIYNFRENYTIKDTWFDRTKIEILWIKNWDYTYVSKQ